MSRDNEEELIPLVILENQRDPLAIVERLKLKWLVRMENMLDSGAMSATDMTTLSRVLMANGWVLDPMKLPRGLQDRLGDKVDPRAFSEDDPDVIPISRFG